jgi:hypothetical protein
LSSFGKYYQIKEIKNSSDEDTSKSNDIGINEKEE